MSTKKTEAKITKKAGDTVKILDVGVNRTTLDRVLKSIRDGQSLFMVSVNPEYLIQAQEDPEFKKVLSSADLALADGVGLKLAVPDLEIIPGRKLVAELLKQPYKFFFLGGRNGVAADMSRKFGGGFDPGEINLKRPTRNAEIIQKIKQFKPDILLTAYNAPEQEKWLWANKSRLQVRVLMGVGGTFDYLTGRATLPPEWVTSLGLEWLWRLIHEPCRWRRQVRLVKFVISVLRDKIKQ